MKRRRIRVKEVKLKRQKVHGFAYSDGLVEIDPRQRSRCYLNTLIHEGLHVMFQSLSESKVNKVACAITRTVWEAGYRRMMK